MDCTRLAIAAAVCLGLLAPAARARADQASLTPTAQASPSRPLPPPGRPPGAPPPLHLLTPQQREAERLRLHREIRLLKDELRRNGEAEADRRDPNWWDLPARRGQQRRLRQLRMLRSQLERRQRRLARLEGRHPGLAGRDAEAQNLSPAARALDAGHGGDEPDPDDGEKEADLKR